MNAEDKKLLTRLWAYLRPNARLLGFATLTMVVVAGAETAIPGLMKTLLDNGFSGKLDDKLWQIPAFLVGLALTRSLAQFLSNYLLSRVISQTLLRFREQMFWRLLHLKADYFLNNSSASLINAIVFEVNNVLSIMGGLLINFARDLLTVIGLAAYLAYLNWRLTLLVLVIFPVIAVVMNYINKRLRGITRKQQSLLGELANIVQESSAGHRVVKISCAESYEMERFMARARAVNQFELKAAITGGLNQPITQLLAAIALSAVLVIALIQSSAQGVTVGGFAGFVTAMMMIISPLKSLAGVGQPLQRGLTASEMIFKLLDQAVEGGDQEILSPSHFSQTKGQISFQGVSFSYGQSQGRKDALDQVSFEIHPGEVIAFVGPSGGGKSTLVNMLPRFFIPTEGTIFLDGINLDNWNLSDLRYQLAFVGQDVVLFNDSVAANVAYGSDGSIDRDRVAKALDAANLSAYIKELPSGIDTLVGNNANQLSGGQRQRLAIARAIYKNAPILILDEATSALDSESERLVQEALDRLMVGRTTLIIAHRLSTIEHADRIIVLDQGKVVEQGTHQNLIGLSGGIYAHFHHLQFAT